MRFLRLYVRVLELLGPEARLGWALALAGVALAAANFVEPILFGRIVDALANAQGGSRQLDWGVLLPLVSAWVGFGLFIIVASTIVSLQTRGSGLDVNGAVALASAALTSFGYSRSRSSVKFGS